jgi:site-specific recombinase XerD
MIHYFSQSAEVLERWYAGPLGDHIDGFAKLLFDQGYATNTAKTKIRLVADLSRWLERKQLTVRDLDENRINDYLRFRANHLAPNRNDQPTFRVLLEQLRNDGLIRASPPDVKDGQIDRIENDYVRYLTQERGLTQSTLAKYLPIMRQFLTVRFGNGLISLKELSLDDITQFILRHAQACSRRRAQLLVTVLRSFLRFVYQKGQTPTDLSTCVPTVANWSLSELPIFLRPEDIERLLQSCDKSSIIGQRDYAVLLLLARLGLRAGEVVHMVLEDIDWEAGELIIRGKSFRQDRLPLLQDVGEALATYLYQGRPRCSSRRVFIRNMAPHKGFSSSTAIGDIVRRAFKRAGLQRTHKGAHLLRHSLATQMLNNGSSLNEIGEILRHEQPHTTEIYAKVDWMALISLAQPWPGEWNHE